MRAPREILRAWKPDVIVVLLTLLTAPLFLYGLGSTYLWQDEAQTALLARSVLRHGVPMVGEGPESLSAHAGEDAGPGGVYLQIAWLQAYVAAAGFALFGESAWVARAPFALAGWLAVPLVAWTMRRAGASVLAARLASLLTALSVPFIVCSRQARYYALAAAVTLLVAGTYAALSRQIGAGPGRPGHRAAVAFGVSACLLVLSFDLTALGVLGGVGAHWLLTRAGRDRWDSRWVVPYATACLLLGAWLALSLTAPSRREVGDLGPRLRIGLSYYLGQLDAHIVPLPYLALLLGLTRRRGTGDRSAAALLACLALGGLGGATLAPSRFFRYIVPVAPLALGLTALGLSALATRGRAGRVLSGALVVAVVTSTAPFVVSHALLATLARATGLVTVRDRPLAYRVPLADLFRELRDPPRGPIAAVVEHLRANARPGQAIVTTYGELPLKFHTNLRVYGGETAELPPDDARAEWLWRRTLTGPAYREIRESVDWVDRRLAQGGYRRVGLPVADRRWENREDPEWHVFTNPGPAAPPVVLYVRD